NGRYALDHTTNDPLSRDIFCMVAGPSGVVDQGQVLSQTYGSSIDIVPTIADILGFKDGIPGLLPGASLTPAFL
ncbi:MAG: hypothetical protein LPK28_01155, partial [Bacteroidota bacterium]|nr:hypothetical protein [Bacteroidota bacterium]